MSSSPLSTENYTIKSVAPMSLADKHETETVKHPIDDDTYKSETKLRMIVPTLKGEVTHIEFVRAFGPRDEAARGVRLYDRRGNALVHVVHALIGYDGSGPMLTRALLEMLGFPESVFNQINELARPLNQNYGVVLDIK